LTQIVARGCKAAAFRLIRALGGFASFLQLHLDHATVGDVADGSDGQYFCIACHRTEADRDGELRAIHAQSEQIKAGAIGRILTLCV
jgi:hypothetical protein